MLYRTRRPAYLYANVTVDGFGDTYIATVPADTTCLLLQSSNVAAGLEYDKILFEGQVGYVHCTLGDRVKE